jgi:hypothetical protein
VDAMRGETVESELDRLIERRHDRRVAEEGERPEEEAFMVSERAYFARLETEGRNAWVEYHRAQAERHRRNLEALIAHHEERASKLPEGAA